MTLLPTLARLAQLQREAVDRLALQEAAEAAADRREPAEIIATVTRHLQVAKARFLKAPDESATPALIHAPDGRWGILRGRNAQRQWISEWWSVDSQQWAEHTADAFPEHVFATLKLSRPYVASTSPVFQLIVQELLSHRRTLVEIVLGGIIINVLALMTSLYSMQVYDRVVPFGASQTLLVLTLGILAATGFDYVAKRVRSGLNERLVDQLDERLSRTVFMRFLAIRLDQLPPSVGSLAAQLRGFETVRGFLSALISSLMVDAPFALLFVALIWLIAGNLALIPLLFFVLSILIGIYYRREVERLADKANAANSLKTGLLVEVVEGAETVKSGQGGWRMLSRWMQNSDEARRHELDMRHISEHAQYLTGMFQQVSYVLLIASGALLISQGSVSMGGLIAASILSGRILAPVAAIPNLMVQWAHAKAALQGLDKLWALEDDHQGLEQPILLDNIRGQYRLESVEAGYAGSKALLVKSLAIRPGEKIGILGPVGAGKTTLLRLLSGMYKPQAGRILLDDVDLAHIAKPALADSVGFVAQDGRLFAGTLRDNLILGLVDPGDEAILQAARQTGLLQTVITQLPKGLQQPIAEGGTGLSGGQRQLVNLTRAFLRQPRIWLLDEPTASMDRGLEMLVLQSLKAALTPEAVLVMVTHKPEMLELCDRLIVVANHQIVMDGPKALVLQKLQEPVPAPGGAA